MQNHIRLAILEDHPLYMNGLITLLSPYEDIRIVAKGQTVQEGIQILINDQPDIMLLDIDLPDGKGIQLIDVIKKNKFFTKIIIVSMYHDFIHIQLAEERGASGYLPKNADPEKFISAIRLVYNGSTFFEKLDVKPVNTNEKITKREKEVLEMLSEGKSRETIADLLCISPETLKTHIKNLVTKTNVSSVNELITGYLQSRI